MTKPLISVVMPCFNAAPFVEQAITSVLYQSYPNIEIIVIDDGSTDGSSHIINALNQKHKQLRVFKQNNQGPYPARNLGIENSNGDFLAFLDADDYWTSDCIESLYTALQNNEADISYCGWQNISENGESRPPYIPPAYEAEDIISSFLRNCPWPIHAALVRKTCINEIRGFSTRYFSSMDYDFWLRLITVSKKITRVPRVMAFYRWHDYGQISSIKWQQVIDAWNVRKDFCLNYPEIIAHINETEKRSIIDDFLRTNAYAAFWKRDLKSAQKLFMTMLFSNKYRVNDLPYIGLSLLPHELFSGITHIINRIKNDE